MDWINAAKTIFASERPQHFTDFPQCEESFEHDQTLINSTIEEIGLSELGNPGWDPICSCSVEGKKYFMPAFIRLSLETIDHDSYFYQFLFHLTYDDEKNNLLLSCSPTQREFIAHFIAYMIDSYPKQIEDNCSMDDSLFAYELWINAITTY